MKQFKNKHTGTIATKKKLGPFSTFEFEGYSVNVICELSGDWEPVEDNKPDPVKDWRIDSFMVKDGQQNVLSRGQDGRFRYYINSDISWSEKDLLVGAPYCIHSIKVLSKETTYALSDYVFANGAARKITGFALQGAVLKMQLDWADFYAFYFEELRHATPEEIAKAKESDIHVFEQAIPDKTNVEDSVKALCGAMDKLGKDRVSQIIKDVKKQFGDHKFIFEIPDEEEPSWTLAELESLNTCGDQMKGEYLVIKKSDLI